MSEKTPNGREEKKGTFGGILGGTLEGILEKNSITNLILLAD